MVDRLTPRVTTAQARAVAAGAHRALQERKQRVNDLNVYPVPDGDTGTNLLLTVKSIVDELARLDDASSPEQVCEAVANAALMGARGNSGVILSQIVRGGMEALKEAEDGQPLDVAALLRRATDTAYRAVRRPVEGTMLTVLREMTEAAEAAYDDRRLPTYLGSIVEAGWASVERTPTLLKVLADAGVVDAGGYGLVVLLQGMTGSETALGLEGDESIWTVPALEMEEGEIESSLYTYCTSFLLRGDGLDTLELETLLNPLGDSLLVVGSDSQVKVHIHTDEPGVVLSLATARGTLSQVDVGNMHDQTAEREARLRARSSAPLHVGETQVVAVVVGGGVRDLFESMGAGPLVEGGQSMNPSAEDLMKALALTEASSVIILPNNKNIVMTAEQVAQLASKDVVVLPTSSMQAGLSAMVVFDADASLEDNVREMTEAVGHTATGEITRAVRHTRVDGIDIAEGSYIGLVGGAVVVSSESLSEAARAVTIRLLEGDKELVTVLTGEGAPAEEVEAAVNGLLGSFGQVEFEVHSGGQPLYPLLLAAE